MKRYEGKRSHGFAGAAECADNPNDPCCVSCLLSDVSSECQASYDAACSARTSTQVPLAYDQHNVRCFEQRRRFGLDLMYPVDRYVHALTRQRIVDARTGQTIDNPLLLGTGEERPDVGRDPGRILFVGMVGVPWQDIATPSSLNDPETLAFLDAAQLGEKSLTVDGKSVSCWDVILGTPSLSRHSEVCRQDSDAPECRQAPIPPLDPFMMPAIEERPAGAENPITGDAIVPSSSTDPQANAINGHETNNLVPDSLIGPPRSDLQYSCIFPLSQPMDKATCSANGASCDCEGEPSRNSPVCQPPSGGASEPAQYFGKAYPAPRILQVVRDVGQSGLLGSICPKVTSGSTAAAGYGYNPMVDAMVRELSERVDEALEQ